MIETDLKLPYENNEIAISQKIFMSVSGSEINTFFHGHIPE